MNKEKILSLSSIIIGTLILFGEKLSIPFLFHNITMINALFGSLFIIKGFLLFKSCYFHQIHTRKQIDYIGIIMSLYLFITSAIIIESGIMRVRGFVFVLEDNWSIIVGLLFIILGYYNILSSVDCLRKKD